MFGALRTLYNGPRSARHIGRFQPLKRCYGTTEFTDNTTPITCATSTETTTQDGWLFIDSVFPVRLGAWDLRHYIGAFREEALLGRLQTILGSVQTHGFKTLSLEPRIKDGGVFVKFAFNVDDDGQALDRITEALEAAGDKVGGLPSWNGLKTGKIWLVKGKPWREDLNRFASSVLKVSFDGPDIREEALYSIFRPFGRITDLTNPVPVPANTLRSSNVTFRRARSATIAHNCTYGLSVSSSSTPGALTKLYTMYERPTKAHAVRDWLAGHPRIVLPVVIFLVGTLTYTVFDPVREFVVQGRLLGWFDYRNYAWYRWVRANTVDRLSFSLRDQSVRSASSGDGIWKERKDAEEALHAYLSDLPNTLTFVHGPQGSGKSRMISATLAEIQRPQLVIDCNELYQASSDSVVIRSLARQTGYWPVFPFVNSLNNLIDIASVGLMGQKAGLSTSLVEQVKQILDVVASSLKGVSSHQHQAADQRAYRAEQEQKRKAEEAVRLEYIRRGVWHDGRIDCVAGNGIMSELGIGDEYMRPEDFGADVPHVDNASTENAAQEGKATAAAPRKSASEMEAVNALPVVVIRNFATKRGKDEVLTVIAQWAASLVENQIAHVVVVSDNRENAKQLAQALPSKPLNSIPLSDADSSSALSFVAQKLHDVGVEEALTNDRKMLIERLGGRASDLEMLVHKVRNGQTIEAAVEDIISRSVSELRKNAFGEDAEDAKSLPWKREQAWVVLKLLSKHVEIAYHDILLDFPFKGDEMALRNMEHADLISIGTHNGRPSVIRPGRPVYRFVFERLVADSVFQAIQDMSANDKLIASAESTISVCEEELIKLKSIDTDSLHWWSGHRGARERAAYLTKKMYEAALKVETLEAKNAELKKLLAKAS